MRAILIITLLFIGTTAQAGLDYACYAKCIQSGTQEGLCRQQCYVPDIWQMQSGHKYFEHEDTTEFFTCENAQINVVKKI